MVKTGEKHKKLSSLFNTFHFGKTLMSFDELDIAPR